MSLTEAYWDPTRSELVTLQHFYSDQKYKSASRILSSENKTSIAGLVGHFWALKLNQWVVWQSAKLRPLPPIAWCKITVSYSKLCGSTSVDILALLDNLSLTLSAFFLPPAINALLLSPYFPHSFVSKDTQVSLTFPDSYCCGRMKWVCFTLISSESILILCFYFIDSLELFFSFLNSSLQTNT